jgi:hypothetical protein
MVRHDSGAYPDLPTDRHRELMALLHAHSHPDAAGRLVSWWPQRKLAADLGVSVRTLRNVLADLRQPGLDPRHPRGNPPGLRLGYVKVEPTTYRDQATGRHRLGGNLYVLVESRQQATPPKPVFAGHVNRQEQAVACLNKKPTASEERKVSNTSPTAVSNPCGWSDCDACAALVRFTQKWEAGEIQPRAPVTSAWWERAEADAFYRRGMNLPPTEDGRLFEVELEHEHDPARWARA